MNPPSLLLRAAFLAVAPMAAWLVHAQEPETAALPVAEQKAAADVAGSTAFCLYELPTNDEGKRRWLNLGIVQYLEYNRNELKIYYGGGNLGSGHEAKIPVADAAQLDAALTRIKQAAAACR